MYRVALGETSTIGSLSDIEGIMHNADALRAFFRKYYCPANACVVVCGTFDPDAVLACIDQHFRHIEAGECTRDNGTDVVEPILPQRGVRSVDVAGEMPMGTLSFRAPDGVSREGVVLELLATWMSSGPAGPFAALLQDPELHAVDADFSRTKDVSLFTLWVSPISGGDATQRVERLQRAVLQAVLSSDPPCLGMTEDVLHGLKLTVDRGWQHEVNSTSGYAQQVVESFARCNSPFDVVERHHTLTHLTLADVQDTWRKVFVTFRMTLGRVLPELAPLELRDPTVTTYDVQGDAPVPVSGVPARALPWGEAVETPGGVYLMDATSPDVCVRVHIPCQTCGNSEATLRAALAMTGLKLDDGQVVKESQLHQEFTERGAHVSVTGTHAGLDVRLNAPADRDVGRLVQLLRAGIASPCVSQHDFARKQQFLGEIAVGGDYDVNTAARGLFSRVLFHDAQDPRRMASGADTSRALHGVRKARVVDGLTALSAQPAWVTCVAPSHAHLRAVRAAFEREGGATPSRDRGLQPPGVSPHAGRTVTQSMPGKTSCTMILGCASGIGAASEHALPLSLALDALGGGFSSRLMQVRRRVSFPRSAHRTHSPHSLLSRVRYPAVYRKCARKTGLRTESTPPPRCPTPPPPPVTWSGRSRRPCLRRGSIYRAGWCASGASAGFRRKSWRWRRRGRSARREWRGMRPATWPTPCTGRGSTSTRRQRAANRWRIGSAPSRCKIANEPWTRCPLSTSGFASAAVPSRKRTPCKPVVAAACATINAWRRVQENHVSRVGVAGCGAAQRGGSDRRSYTIRARHLDDLVPRGVGAAGRRRRRRRGGGTCHREQIRLFRVRGARMARAGGVGQSAATVSSGGAYKVTERNKSKEWGFLFKCGSTQDSPDSVFKRRALAGCESARRVRGRRWRGPAGVAVVPRWARSRSGGPVGSSCARAAPVACPPERNGRN